VRFDYLNILATFLLITTDTIGQTLNIGNNQSHTTSGNATYTGLSIGNNASLTVKSPHTLTINGTATTNNSNNTITVENGATLTITGCLTDNNNITLIINGNATIQCVNFGNNGILTVEGTGNLNINGNITAGQNTFLEVELNGNLSVGGNVTVGSGGSSVIINGNFTIGGQYNGPTPSGSGDMNDANEIFLPVYLPVDIKEMSVSWQSFGKTIYWTTSSEHNSSHFDILNSKDGHKWGVIGSVNAAGYSTQELNYEFVDIDASRTNDYYKLIQYDKDGLFEEYGILISNCTNISDLIFISYPNPSNANFSVMFSGVSPKIVGNYVLNLNDLNGQRVLHKEIHLETGSNVILLDRQGIRNGLYTIELSDENGIKHRIKHLFN
jgi:hypothetical protein